MPTPRFADEPPFQHGQRARTAVLYCNLGTPDEATAPAVRRYLAEFLSDPRVVEIPRLLWWLILHGVILRFRPAKSAAKYASIWSTDGSPLRVWTEKQALLLQGWLAQRGHPVLVRHAMRYGQTSIADATRRAQGARGYPCTGDDRLPAVFGHHHRQRVRRGLRLGGRTRNIPELRFVNRYHDDPAYIEALTQHIRASWKTHGRGDKLVMSFHGIPHRSLLLGDPYHCECHVTARLLANRLGLSKDDYMVTFQSRLGRAKWLQPYTEPSLVKMARDGLKRVDVVCPGFTSDCLETLEEIGMEGKAAYLAAGGQEFHFITCLNDRPEWIGALTTLAQSHLQGWPTGTTDDSEAREASRQRALALGAKQ